MITIVHCDNKWGIGKNNDLMFKLPKDMKFFRETTSGNTVVMGSNTLKSLPGGKPLPNRKSIVLFPGGDTRDDCTVVQSLDELMKEVENADTEVYVMGGAMLYHTLMPYCEKAYITKVSADGNAEVFLDNLDETAGWELTAESEPIMDGEYEIRFLTYTNRNVRKYKYTGDTK